MVIIVYGFVTYKLTLTATLTPFALDIVISLVIYMEVLIGAALTTIR